MCFSSKIEAEHALLEAWESLESKQVQNKVDKIVENIKKGVGLPITYQEQKKALGYVASSKKWNLNAMM